MHHPRTRPTATAVGITPDSVIAGRDAALGERGAAFFATRGGLALDQDRSGHRRFQYLYEDLLM